MPRVRLTDAKVRSFKAMPPGEQQSYYDTRIPGFGVRVGSRARTWFLRYRTRTGTRRRYTLGRYPDLSLKEAREQAIIVRGRLAKGDDPATERTRQRLTLLDLAARFRKDELVKLKPKTQEGYNACLNRWILPRLGQLEVDEVEPLDVHEMVLKVKGKVMPNRCLQTVSRLYSFGIQLGLAKRNPAASLRLPSKEKPRSRVLSDPELCAVYRAASETKSLFRFAIHLWMLTGMRSSELLSLEWKHVVTTEIDGEAVPTLRIPARLTKQARDHFVILSTQAQRVLEALRQQSSDSRWLFPSHFTSSHLRSPLGYVTPLREKSGVDSWSPHDLRRTASTILGRLGIPDKINDLVLGHKPKDLLNRHYNHYGYGEELRDAWQALGDHVESVVGAAQIAPEIRSLAVDEGTSESDSPGSS